MSLLLENKGNIIINHNLLDYIDTLNFLSIYQAKWVTDPFAPELYCLIQNIISPDIGYISLIVNKIFIHEGWHTFHFSPPIPMSQHIEPHCSKSVM